nr:hypothetical protein [Candidatus Cloacimonadota bacterium]
MGCIMGVSFFPMLVIAEVLPWMFLALLVFIGMLILIFYSMKIKSQQEQIHELRKKNEEYQAQLSNLSELELLKPELRKIARLDHDVNTPLCVITMSLGRAKKLAIDSGDDMLLGNVEDIMRAVSRIGEIMEAVRVLKTIPIIKEQPNNTAENKQENRDE